MDPGDEEHVGRSRLLLLSSLPIRDRSHIVYAVVSSVDAVGVV
jgi:hypothetical protein